MPVSPFEGDFDRRAAADGRPEPRHDPAVQPEVPVSAREEGEEPGTEVTLEEPGYGHGV
jgi:hypothetical protein